MWWLLQYLLGRVVYRRHFSKQASAVAYDPSGRVLAVGTNKASTSSIPSLGYFGPNW